MMTKFLSVITVMVGLMSIPLQAENGGDYLVRFSHPNYEKYLIGENTPRVEMRTWFEDKSGRIINPDTLVSADDKLICVTRDETRLSYEAVLQKCRYPEGQSPENRALVILFPGSLQQEEIKSRVEEKGEIGHLFFVRFNEDVRNDRILISQDQMGSLQRFVETLSNHEAPRVPASPTFTHDAPTHHEEPVAPRVRIKGARSLDKAVHEPSLDHDFRTDENLPSRAGEGNTESVRSEGRGHNSAAAQAPLQAPEHSQQKNDVITPAQPQPAKGSGCSAVHVTHSAGVMGQLMGFILPFLGVYWLRRRRS